MFDADCIAEVPRQALEVIVIGGDHDRVAFAGYERDVRVDDVGRARGTQQGANFVRLFLFERDDVAAAEQTAELDLPARPARLGDHGRRHYGDQAELEPNTMVGPGLPPIAICSNEHPRVIEVAHADRAWPPPES